jgi:AbiTii
MARNRGGLLAQIEGDVADHTVPLSSLLQKCIVLGGQARSEKMRDWARRELNGYLGADTVPDYRHVPAVLMALITNNAGYNGRSTRIDPSVFAPQMRDMLREQQVDLEDAIFAQGVGELEALAGQGECQHDIIPSWASFIANTLSRSHMAPNSRVAEVYWTVPNASILGILVRIRTALADLVAELIALTPRDQEVPDKQAADQVVQFVITGDRSVINYSPQQAAGGGTNVRVDDHAAAGQVTVSGAHGTAIGSQIASGANSSVVGSQSVNGAESRVVGGQAVQVVGDAVTAGRDATISAAEDKPVKESWWARLRKRGAIVAFSTIIGAIAAVAGVVFAILIAVGWKP